MAALSEWLQIMLGEIARKGEDLERARAEEAKRATEEHSVPPGSPRVHPSYNRSDAK